LRHPSPSPQEPASFCVALRSPSVAAAASTLTPGSGDVVSLVVTACAAPALLMSTTLLTAFFLRHRGRAVSFPLAAAPFSAMALGALFTHFLPQQSAPDSEGWEPCFPSGHTTGMTAELMTLSYFLRREGIIGDPGAIAIAAFCVPGGLNRLYRDRHWASDIVAGWSAGLFVAASCIAVSELSLMRKDAGHSPASSVPDLTAL